MTQCDFDGMGETVPLFWVGPFEGLDQPPVNISYQPDHKPAAENYALAVRLAVPFVTEWFGTLNATPEARGEVVELSYPAGRAIRKRKHAAHAPSAATQNCPD